VRNRFVIIIYILLLTSCLPEGDQTLVYSVIPKEFTKEWYANIRCQGATYDAMKIAFNTEDQNTFEACGTGHDYDIEESIISVKFKGNYNPSNDSLSGIFTFYDPEFKVISRIDRFQIKFGSYKGDPIPLTLQFMNDEIIGCNLEITLSFSFNETNDSLKKAFNSSNFLKYFPPISPQMYIETEEKLDSITSRVIERRNQNLIK
jgi:hypothetical protein